jgi:hypothetical protein
MADDQFDEELESLRVHIENKMTALIERKFQELERKQLLRLRGQKSCRICQGAEIGPGADPPFSDDERLFHAAAHGELLIDSDEPAPRNWPDFEHAAAEVKRRFGR